MHAYQGRMNDRRRSEWWPAAGLVLLSLVPVGAGMVRMGQLAGGAQTAENARYFASPAPIVLHVISITLFCLLGALQFVPSLRRGRPAWHRIIGRLVLPAGLVAAATGLWLSQFSALPANSGRALYVIRLAVGVWMIVSLVRGYLAIRRRDVDAHRDWVLRGYAIGLGAGTQFFTNLPWVLLFGAADAPTYAVLMGAGWAINFVLAEAIIRRRRLKASALASAGGRASTIRRFEQGYDLP